MELSGIDGHVEIGGTPYNFSKWKVSYKNKAPDTSGFNSQGFGDNVRGKQTATITLSGPYDGDMPLECGEVYEFHLGFTDTLELVVNARVTELTPENDYEDRPTLSVTAESTGPMVPNVV